VGEDEGAGVTESTPRQAMGTNCWAHKHTELVPLEVHHVWPLGEGGPNIAANKVSICSNAHSSAHDLLAKMLKAADGLVPWPVRRRYGLRVRRIAEAGYRAIRTGQVVRPDGA
jgi:hypothetical protein